MTKAEQNYQADYERRLGVTRKELADGSIAISAPTPVALEEAINRTEGLLGAICDGHRSGTHTRTAWVRGAIKRTHRHCWNAVVEVRAIH